MKNMCSEKDILEMPYSTEHGRMRQSGLGYQCDIRFHLSGLNADVRAMFFREFLKLREAPECSVFPKGDCDPK